jgi:hypothetical protein
MIVKYKKCTYNNRNMFRKNCFINIIFIIFSFIGGLYPLKADTPLPRYYVVGNWFVNRDSLWNIAANPAVYNDPNMWYKLYNFNKNIFPKKENPNFILPGMIIEIPSINGEFRTGIYSVEIHDYDFPLFSDLFWKNNKGLIDKGIIDDNVLITFISKNIPNNSAIKIMIYERNTNTEDDLIDIFEITSNDHNIFNWTIEFDEKKCRKSAIEIQENRYTIPEYYFIAKYGNYISEKSDVIKIRGWLSARAYDEETNFILRNFRMLAIFGDDTEFEVYTDNEGWIHIRDIPIGEVYFLFMGDSNDD